MIDPKEVRKDHKVFRVLVIWFERNKLTKLGRCDSYTIKWLNNRTARLLGLLGIQLQTARTVRIGTIGLG